MFQPQGQPQQPMPPQGGAPQGAPPPQSGEGGGQQQIMQLPPEVARHIDPNDAIQMLLLQRIDKFTEADGAAMQQLTPQQVATLKKVIPEVAFLLDMVHAGQMPQGGGAMPPGAVAPAGGGAPPPPQGGAPGMAQAPMPRPAGSGLSRF
jgi:hypothetical protein